MLWREVQTGLVPRGGGGFAGSSNRWGILVTGVVVRVSVLWERVGVGVGMLHTGGSCEVIVLFFFFFAISFLSVCV
jgi:hypothetical protein